MQLSFNHCCAIFVHFINVLLIYYAGIIEYLTILYCFCQNMHVFDIIVFLFHNKYFSVEKNIWNLYLFSALQYIYHYTYLFPLRVNCLSFTTVWVGFGNFSKAIVLINNIRNIYFYIMFHLFSILCILADTLLQHALQFECLGVIMIFRLAIMIFPIGLFLSAGLYM